MTTKSMEKFDLKMLLDSVIAWRSRITTISAEPKLSKRLSLIKSLGEDIEKVSSILKNCNVEELK
jgi:hypothetical protein